MADDVAPLARQAWIPVWDLPDGEHWVQRVLQHPVCQLVVGSDDARLWGVGTGMNTVDLSGRGWVVGIMLQPAAGTLLLRDGIDTITDSWVDLAEVPGVQDRPLVDRVRALMGPDPGDVTRQDRAVELMAAALRAHLPVSDEDVLVNDLVARVQADPSILRVDQLADAFALSPRHLQRITRHRLGLTPKWLIQRRRLHEAAEALKTGADDLAALAMDLGYVDQAHFNADWKRVTGMTPGSYRDDQ